MFATVTTPIAEGDTVIKNAGPAPADGPALSAWPAVPGYEILGELGRGTMGVVYKARHLRLNRLVALKVVLDAGQARPEDLVRFLGEAESLARCQHPHVVLIYEAGWHDGRPYLAMELVEGSTLAQTCRGEPRPPRQAAALVEPLARALHAAHRRKVVHRDLKPSNVLLTEDGVPKLTDFGLAKRLDGGEDLTATGVLLGTPRYMAPEQALCGDVGPAADVYSLGTILYELLTGEPPFHGGSLLSLLDRVTSEPPLPPAQVRPGVPPDLEAICLKCLQKEPRDRFASAGALAEDLARFLAGQPVLARPPRPWRRAAAWARRHPGSVGLWVGAALAALASLPCSVAVVPAGAFVALGALAYAGWCLARVKDLEGGPGRLPRAKGERTQA
jgi:serine/threonine protein kinase